MDSLAPLLAQAATNDHQAFVRFYDQTAPVAFRLEVLRTGDVERAVEAVGRRFVQAWLRCSHHERSGLSSLAWLLSLPVPPPAGA